MLACGTPAPVTGRKIDGYPAARAEDLARFPPLETEALGEPVHRLLACVDLRPARLRNLGGALIVLNVAAAGAAVSVPYARDAVTGEPAPVPAEELLDEEQGTPCDRRPLARREWEDNRARRENRR